MWDICSCMCPVYVDLSPLAFCLWVDTWRGGGRARAQGPPVGGLCARSRAGACTMSYTTSRTHTTFAAHRRSADGRLSSAITRMRHGARRRETGPSVCRVRPPGATCVTVIRVSPGIPHAAPKGGRAGRAHRTAAPVHQQHTHRCRTPPVADPIRYHGTAHTCDPARPGTAHTRRHVLVRYTVLLLGTHVRSGTAHTSDPCEGTARKGSSTACATVLPATLHIGPAQPLYGDAAAHGPQAHTQAQAAHRTHCCPCPAW